MLGEVNLLGVTSLFALICVEDLHGVGSLHVLRAFLRHKRTAFIPLLTYLTRVFSITIINFNLSRKLKSHMK